MNSLEHLSPIEMHKTLPWRHYLLDGLLATGGTLLVTGVIANLQLYPRIPNISIVYLLVILGLASTRGRFAAILASLVAFLSFDFFIVPPLYTFVIYRIEEWVALFVFLVTAILTGQLTVILRERAEQASRREQETHLLYDLVRVSNREEEPAHQLQSLAEAIVDVFSSWGVKDCAILQPDAAGKLQVQTSAYQPVEKIYCSADEKAIAASVMTHGRTMGLYDDGTSTSFKSTRFGQRIIVRSTIKGRTARYSLRFIPMKIGQRVVGVLRLRVLEDRQQFPREDQLEDRPNAYTTFFWVFLNQVSSLIERVRLQRENLRIEILQRTDALRASLLSSVSHDLRTPLTAIKAAASSLLQEDVQWDDEARRSFAQGIELEADRLNRLVSNLLDMSRIEDGALRPQKEWHSLRSLIHDVLGRLQPLLEGRVVETQLSNDLLLVELDYVQIDQVLTNLLENAVRYTPPQSSIEVSATIEGDRVIFSVADRGPGIPSSELERIFDKFYRVLHGPRQRGYPSGSGLGLAVCKGVVEAHGGRIWAELRDGGGLIVAVELPVGERERIVL